MSAYDVVEQQLLIYFDDPGHCWHHRILLVHLGGGRCLACSADFDVEILDVGDYAVIPLTRGALFPPRAIGDFYTRQPLDPAGLDRARLEARALAVALGAAPPVAPGGGAVLWLFSDTSHARFGQPIEDALLFDPNATVQRDSAGLVHEPGETWTTMERVRRDDVEA